MNGEKIPFLTGETLDRILKEHRTPFHIYDEAGIRKNAKRLLDAFSWNPGFKEYFAVKATPSPKIIEILTGLGCGADCSSYTELLIARAMGLSGGDIVFSSNATPPEDFRLAAELGALINLDDITHIDYLEKCAGLPERICCRYNPGDFSISNSIMDNPAEAKYGFTREQMTLGYRMLSERGVKRFGIHSFLSSNTLTDEYYPILARDLFLLAAELSEETGVKIDHINLSGGIGVPYRPGERENDIYAISDGVRRAFEEILVPAGLGDIAIYAELGRYMLAPYGALVSTAVHEKRIYKNYIGLDSSACDLMRPAMYGAYHHITVIGKENAPADHVYDITGSLCENNDKFAIDRSLPEICLGDRIYIHDTGAHGHSMGYNYNGKLRSAELLLRENGEVELIRRAETPEDYFATLDILEIHKKLTER